MVNTRDLLKYGWPETKKGCLKSITACYLGGFLLGKKSKNIKKVILDTGLIPSTKGSRVYACVKGIADAGIEIKYDKKILPSEEKIKAKYKFFEKIKNKLDKLTTKLIISQKQSENKDSLNNKEQLGDKINDNKVKK